MFEILQINKRVCRKIQENQKVKLANEKQVPYSFEVWLDPMEPPANHLQTVRDLKVPGSGPAG